MKYHDDVYQVEPSPEVGLAPFLATTARFRTPQAQEGYVRVRLAMVRAGTGQVTMEGRAPLPVKAGDVVVVMPARVVGIVPDGMMTVTWVFLTLEYLVDQVVHHHLMVGSDHGVARLLVGDCLASDPVRVLSVPASQIDGVSRCAEELAGLTADGMSVGDLFVAAQPLMGVFAVVMPLLGHHRGEDQCPCVEALRHDSGGSPVAGLAPPVVAALVWIRAHFREPYSLDMLAQVAGLSRRGLTRSFEAQVGKSPTVVRDELRLDEFCRSLVLSTLSIVQAAARVGWSTDQARRMLVRVTGLTPTQWRADLPYPVSS